VPQSVVAIQIRELKREDADAFRVLRRERLEIAPHAFAESIPENDAITPASIAARLSASSPENFVMGAFAPGDHLVGMAGFSRSPRIKTHHKAVIWGVYVQPTWRNQGVARAIFQALIERARENAGLEQILLTVAADQIAAKRLYTSLGFETFGHEKHALKIDNGYVDEDHMVYWLKQHPD
jgi:RimJ/RimL family protein N-acetyltransferase